MTKTRGTQRRRPSARHCRGHRSSRPTRLFPSSEFLGEEQSCCLINPNNGQEKTTWKVARRPTDSAPHRMRLPAWTKPWWFQQVSDQLPLSCSSQSARISIRKRSRPLERQQPNPKRWCLSSGRGFATKLPRADLWRLISRPVLKAATYTCCSMPVSARCTRAIVIPRLVQLYDAPSRTQKCLSSKTIFSLWTLPKQLMPAC